MYKYIVNWNSLLHFLFQDPHLYLEKEQRSLLVAPIWAWSVCITAHQCWPNQTWRSSSFMTRVEFCMRVIESSCKVTECYLPIALQQPWPKNHWIAQMQGRTSVNLTTKMQENSWSLWLLLSVSTCILYSSVSRRFNAKN